LNSHPETLHDDRMKFLKMMAQQQENKTKIITARPSKIVGITNETTLTTAKDLRHPTDEIRVKIKVLATNEDDRNHVIAPSPTQEGPTGDNHRNEPSWFKKHDRRYKHNARIKIESKKWQV
jgi:hypothetical protein